MKRFVAALILMSWASAGWSLVTVTATESGGNVTFTSTGTADINNLSQQPVIYFGQSIYPSSGFMVLSPTTGSVRYFNGSGGDAVQGPSSFGGGGLTVGASSVSGTSIIGVDEFGGATYIIAPANSSGVIQANVTNVFTGTFSSLGLVPGVYTWTWGSGAHADSLVLTIGSAPAPSAVPTLSEWAQLMLAMMVLSLIGWHFHRERSY